MDPKISHDMSDALLPGVAVEMSEHEAARWGAFEETAVSPEDVDDANLDLVEDTAHV